MYDTSLLSSLSMMINQDTDHYIDHNNKCVRKDNIPLRTVQSVSRNPGTLPAPSCPAL